MPDVPPMTEAPLGLQISAGLSLGYAVGALLAVVLDRLFTGAPIRGSLRPCRESRPPPLWWTGTVGFLLVRGRCPSGCRLPARLWYLPLLGAAAGGVIAWRAVDLRHAVLSGVFGTLLLAFVATDFERHLLPNRVMYPALALAALLSGAWPDRSAVESLTGGLLGFGIMAVLFLLAPKMGFGDVKLAALLGLVSGVAQTVPALIIGMIAAGLAALFMVVIRRAGRKALIAYGPYLALGAFVGMLAP